VIPYFVYQHVSPSAITINSTIQDLDGTAVYYEIWNVVVLLDTNMLCSPDDALIEIF
jgi:hypothetical protein